jgi:hypothetical protein
MTLFFFVATIVVGKSEFDIFTQKSVFNPFFTQKTYKTS